MVKEAVWRSAIPQVMQKIQHDLKAIHDGVFDTARESIVNGSTLTGAPGQPEDLRDGQFKVVQEGERKTALGTDDPSAPAVETGISSINGAPVTLHSAIGGFHSIALTQQADDAIVRKVVREVVGG